MQPLLDFWMEALSLTDWQITWELVDKIEGNVNGIPPGARVISTGPYSRAHIIFQRSQVDECTLKEELEITIIHELCHCLISELRENLMSEIGDSTPIGNELMWQVEALCDRLAVCLWRIAHRSPLLPGYSPIIR